MNRAGVYSRSVLLEKLKRGEIEPAYFLYGEESYLIEQLIHTIARKFVVEPEKEINYFLRFAPDNSLDDILALTAGGGLFAAKKIVVLKDYQNLKNPDLAGLLKYLQHPNPDICLLIIARTDQIKQSKFKNLQGQLPFVQVQPLKNRELADFIRAEFKAFNKNVTDEAINTLIFMVGDQIHDLRTEIVQVCNYAIDREDIGVTEIEEVVGVYVNQSVYEYIDAISSRDLATALFILHNLLERGESPGYFLTLLFRQISIMWKLKGFYDSGKRNDYEIGRELGIYSNHLSKHKNHLSGWSTIQLKKAIEQIDECDRNLKTSQLRPNLLLDLLSFKLVHSIN